MAAFPTFSAGEGASSWEDWMRMLQQRQQQTFTQASAFPTSGSGSAPPPSPVTTTSTQRNAPISTLSTTAPTSNPPSRPNPTATQSTARTATTQRNATGPIPKGHFFSGMDQTMLDMLRDNPDQTIFEYLKSKGYSSILQSVLGRYDPLSIARALGQVGFGAGSTGQLGAQEGIMNTLMGGKSTIDPRAIVGSIAGAHYGKSTPADSLAFYLDSTRDVDPNNQVKNVSGIILSALQGIVPDDSLKAYANLLNRQALSFLSERMHDTGHYGRESFLDYLRRVYPGQGLGFY